MLPQCLPWVASTYLSELPLILFSYLYQLPQLIARRGTGALGMGDGIKTHTDKWMIGKGPSPMDMIAKIEPIEAKGDVAVCYGGVEPALGHEVRGPHPRPPLTYPTPLTPPNATLSTLTLSSLRSMFNYAGRVY